MTKPRKAEHYTPSIEVLLGQARPDWWVENSEKDTTKWEARERERALATDRLLRIYWDHHRRGALAQLDPGVVIFCRALQYKNGGRLPHPVGGSPTNRHRRLLIEFSVRQKIAASGMKRGAVQKAIEETASEFCVVPRTVRDIHYDRGEEWLRLVKVEQSRRDYESAVMVPLKRSGLLTLLKMRLMQLSAA
jgi:hypothetical protein